MAVADDVRAAVDAALADQRVLDITYASATRDEVTHRVIQPTRLRAVDGIAYLEAFCRSAGAVRTFRLDRMLAATVGEQFDPDTAGSAGDGPIGPVGVAARTATLRVDPSARWIIDAHRGALVLDDPATGTATVRLPLHSVDWGMRLVLSLRGAAVALEPPELVTAVADAAAAALASYP